MAFTVEALEVAPTSVPNNQPNQFDLPSKEFVGYDPKGTTTVTGSDRAENVKQPNTVEAAAEPAEPAKPEESVTLSPQISALARKEAAQRQRERALLQREKDLAAKLADAEKYQQLKTKVAAKDYSAAEELGLTHEQYTQYLLDKQAGEDPAEQRYRKVESELEQLKKNQEEQTHQEYKANQQLWKQEVKKVVDASEEFSTIKELGAYDAVLKHINDSFDEDNVELTAEEAAKEIEEALVARAEKLASVSKIKKKFEGEPRVLGAPKPSPKTITQNMTVTSEKSKSKPFHLMSESEQIAEAYRRVQAAKIQR
jgi:uncharacterized protein YukE